MTRRDTPSGHPEETGDWPDVPSPYRRAVKDLTDGFAMSWLWTALAVQDIRLRYRGSVLGPIWLTVSTTILAIVMGTLYSHLLVTSVPYYTPYLLSGMVLWQCVVATTNESCQMFLAQGIVRQVPLPYSVHAYRLICRNFLVMGHSAVVVVAALLVFRVPVDWHILLVVPGLLALAINGLWLGTILGMVSARFGDIPPIAASFLQVAFFVTPIFWSADRLGTWQTVAQCNPYFAFIDSIRAPLLGMPIQPYSWLVIALTTLIGGSVSFLFFARFRTRIPYWL